MNRREIIRNSLMAIAASLVPKILRPMDGEIELAEPFYNWGYPLALNDCYEGEPPAWAKGFATVTTKPRLVGFVYYNQDGDGSVHVLSEPIELEVL